MRLRTPLYVEQHFVKRVVDDNRWARFCCKHCDWEHEYVREVASSIAIYLRLAQHLLDEHKVFIQQLAWSAQAVAVSTRQVEP